MTQLAYPLWEWYLHGGTIQRQEKTSSCSYQPNISDYTCATDPGELIVIRTCISSFIIPLLK